MRSTDRLNVMGLLFRPFVAQKKPPALVVLGLFTTGELLYASLAVQTFPALEDLIVSTVEAVRPGNLDGCHDRTEFP